MLTDSQATCTEGGQTSIHYDDKAIEALLDRSQEVEGEGEGEQRDEHENLLANEYLSSFKVSVQRRYQLLSCYTHVSGQEISSCIMHQSWY